MAQNCRRPITSLHLFGNLSDASFYKEFITQMDPCAINVILAGNFKDESLMTCTEASSKKATKNPT